MGGKYKNGYNFCPAWSEHFIDVEVHKAGFLSGIAPSLHLKYIISISLPQVANLVGELAII